jgi:hypothetical protein
LLIKLAWNIWGAWEITIVLLLVPRYPISICRRTRQSWICWFEAQCSCSFRLVGAASWFLPVKESSKIFSSSNRHQQNNWEQGVLCQGKWSVDVNHWSLVYLHKIVIWSAITKDFT